MCFPGVDRVIGRKGAPLSSPPESSFPLQYVNDDDETKLRFERGMCSGHSSSPTLLCHGPNLFCKWVEGEIEMRERREEKKRRTSLEVVSDDSTTS